MLADRQWEFVQSQSASYGSNNTIINTTPFADRNDWFDYSSAFLQVPFEMKATADPTAGVGLYRIGLKPAGYLSLIDRIQIQANNRNISLQNPMLSVYRHLVHMFDWSHNYLKVFGPIMGMGDELPDKEVLNQRFAPQDGTALTTFRANDVAPRQPYAQNTIDPPALNSAVGLTALGPGYTCPQLVMATRGAGGAFLPVNAALFSRMLDTVYPVASESTYAASQGKNYVTQTSTTSLTYTCNAVIPLRFLHDFFDKLGAARNIGMVMTIYFNQTQTGTNGLVVTVDTGLTTTSATVSGFSPIMCVQDVGPAPTTATPPVSTPVAATASVIRIGRDISSGGATPVLLWLPRLVLTAEQNNALRSYKKTIRFRDFTQAVNVGVASGSNFTYQIANGVYNCKRLYVLGYPGATALAAGWAQQGSSYEPYYSTTGFALDNIRVLVNSQPIETIQISQGFRNFLENLGPNYSLNGNMNSSLTSGLYSKRCFDVAPIYMFDLSRYSQGKQASNVVLQATQSSLWAADLNCILEQEFQLDLDYSENACELSIIQNV